jgi:hypothetical protein
MAVNPRELALGQTKEGRMRQRTYVHLLVQPQDHRSSNEVIGPSICGEESVMVGLEWDGEGPLEGPDLVEGCKTCPNCLELIPSDMRH